MSLSEANIFHLRHVLKNFPAKKSAFVDNHRNRVQILCLVGDKNEILVRYRYYGEHNLYSKKLSDDEQVDVGQCTSSAHLHRENDTDESMPDSWKLVLWFQNVGKTIQDLCFDSNGRHLLVVCYDNTLHIVPILWIIDPEFGLKTTTSQEIENFYWLFRSDEITSFIVPFSGPHECSNSKTCPNNTTTANCGQQRNQKTADDNESELDDEDKYTPAQINEMVLSNNAYQSFYMPTSSMKRNSVLSVVDHMIASSDGNSSDTVSVAEKSPDGCEKNHLNVDVQPATAGCPFPLSVVWWSTSKVNEQNPQHRAIIGYSDGSICVVGLAPNCPFIANTSIDSKSGGISKMTICRDSIFNNVSLLITTSMKDQWKLLLEQHKIGYIFPDEINRRSNERQEQNSEQTAESSNEGKQKIAEQDWQIVIPVSDTNKSNDEQETENGRMAIDEFMQITHDSDDFNSNELAAQSSGRHGSNSRSNRTRPAALHDDFIHIPTEQDEFNSNELATQSSAKGSSIIPATRARLASLRDFGARKIGALKMKLIENKIKSSERDQNRRNITQLAKMYMPSALPEILSTSTGPFFTPQFLRDVHLLSALHSYSHTLSVHSMDIGLVPLYLYKIPKDCSNVLITPNIMYTMQTIQGMEQKTGDLENNENLINDSKVKMVNAIGVIGSNLTTLRIGEDSEYDLSSMLALFPFHNETIVDVHRMPNNQPDVVPYNVVNDGTELNDENVTLIGTINSGERQTIPQPRVSSRNYAQNYRKSKQATSKKATDDNDADNFFDMDDKHVVEHNFPTLEYEQCLIVTDQSVYVIEMKHAPHILFLNLIRGGQWDACEEFCKIFNLDYMQCVEYAGDVLLRKNEVTQSLLTYNIAKVPPVKTALKLAMFGQNNALMHLCAMALKIVYVLKSSYPRNQTIKYTDPTAGNSQTCKSTNLKKMKTELNCGVPKTDFSYETDETPADLQMSNSSQFHLSNLLLLTLAEKAIKDKQLMPLWNFLIVNKRYHTNMSSIVLAQSGLYSSTIVLALNRGAHLDAFCALVGVTNQEFGWYSEINDIIYQLSDPIFMECIIYLKSMAMEYFNCIQNKCDKLNQNVLERLRYQLDPFTPIFRPVVSQLSSNFIESDTNDLNKKLIEFCKHLIETFLIVVIKLYVNKNIQDDITNGLNVIYVRNEQNQFAIRIDTGSNVSAGFGHCAAIVDGCCYLWGSSGVNCALSAATLNSSSADPQTSPKCLEFISNMGLEVHAVKCGKAHTLILTNNGLYAMGLNTQQQLGIGKHHIQALQPMLVKEFDDKNVSLIEAGQYHNAVYADGELYTFGWGVYGQLGHGDIFTLDRPKVVRFFSNKNVKQIALGHAHTLVLCGNKSNPNDMVLYAFGCNLFGQLGTGQYHSDSNQKWLKVSSPIRLNINGETVTQIHTKYFTNFVITKTNRLYTWGASPQLIRLLNQSKKRARLAQKFEETKNAITSECFNKRSNSPDKSEKTKAFKDEIKDLLGSSSASGSGSRSETSDKNVEIVENDGNRKDSVEFEFSKTKANLEEKIKSFLRTKTSKSSEDGGSSASTSANDDNYMDDEYTEHFLPSLVDTDDVSGEIVQVSSGLYHNALVTNLSQLYTWGRNLEKQLGRENTRCDLQKPTHLELNDNVVYVECGADFTLILTDQFAVKAFGNNNVGQCGRELNISSDKSAVTPKLVRLRVSKRIVRLPDSSQCIEQPIDVPLPRPKIRMNFDAVRYLKSIPSYRPEYISREIFRVPNFGESPSMENFDGYNLSPRSPKIPNDVMTPLAEEMAGIHLSHSPSSSKNETISDVNVTSEFIHYCLFILHGIYDAHKILSFTPSNEFKVRILMLNYYVKEAFDLCLGAAKKTIEMHQSAEDVDLDNVMLTSYVIKLFEYFTKDASIVPIHRTDLKYLIHAIFMYFIENGLSLQSLEIYFLNNIDHYLFGLAFVLFFNNNNTKLERKVQQKYSHLFSGCASNDKILNFCATTNGSSSLNAGDDEVSTTTTTTTTDQTSHIEQVNEELLDFETIFKYVSTSFKTIICQRLIEFDNELN